MWLSRKLALQAFSKFKAGRVLEQDDEEMIEEMLLAEPNPCTSTSTVLAITAVAEVASIVLVDRLVGSHWLTIGVAGAINILPVLYYRNIMKSIDTTLMISPAVDEVDLSLKKRSITSFCIRIDSRLQLTMRKLLNEQIIELLKICIETAESSDFKDSLLSSFHTDAIRNLLEGTDDVECDEQSSKGLKDFLYLHISEVAKLLVVDLLRAQCITDIRTSINRCSNFSKKVSGVLERLKELKKKVLLVAANRTETSRPIDLKIEKLDSVAFALQDIVDGIAMKSLDESQAEAAICRVLQILKLPSVKKSERLEATAKFVVEEVEAVKVTEKEDEFMVFEAETAKEDEKKELVDSEKRQLLENMESRMESQAMLGELGKVLVGRRSDFERLEREALARFYGVPESELPDEPEKIFDAVGVGENTETQPYDWRAEASSTIGVHSLQDEFLAMLKNSAVEQEVLGD